MIPNSLHAHPEPRLQNPSSTMARYEQARGRFASHAVCQNGSHWPGWSSPTPPAAFIPANTIVQIAM
jgi:hypothetical protein